MGEPSGGKAFLKILLLSFCVGVFSISLYSISWPRPEFISLSLSLLLLPKPPELMLSVSLFSHIYIHSQYIVCLLYSNGFAEVTSPKLI